MSSQNHNEGQQHCAGDDILLITWAMLLPLFFYTNRYW